MPEAATQPSPQASDVLCPPGDRRRIDLYLAAFLAASGRRHASGPHLGPLFEKASAFVLRGGKRLRPRLCLASYRILAGCPAVPPRPVWLAAASLEVFHAFMLVHDDLIDASLSRRGEAALHEAIRLDFEDPDGPRSRKAAGDLGLVAGDLLFALGMRLLGRSGLDDATLGRSQRLLADVLLQTGLGQALDVVYGDSPLDDLCERQIVEAYLRKTARYSVSGPLVLGATIAGASAPICRALDRFGDLLGFGFQVRNDLDALALAEDDIEADHPDLDGGKRTFVLWTAHRRSSEAGRRLLVDALAAPVGVERRRRLLDQIRVSGALEECQDRLARLRREAIDALVRADFDPDQRRAFVTLMPLFDSKVRSRPGPSAGLASILDAPLTGDLAPLQAGVVRR